ncbi:hypothetical protein, partial [Rickettsiales endosymbiont of Peranema trichophorum]|uniref:hypothetical protein n=1 Tax=Rickettsiales endosymbiont of Peranema trichophorum TaxID=2486577 RepID=UPI001A9248A6
AEFFEELAKCGILFINRSLFPDTTTKPWMEDGNELFSWWSEVVCAISSLAQVSVWIGSANMIGFRNAST